MHVTFRDAVPDDLASLQALHTKSWRTAYGAFAPAHLFGKPLDDAMAARWKVWPAERLIRVAVDGPILAFAAVEFKPAPYLDNLHVAPDLKRSGLGRRLMSDLARVLLAAGHTSLDLTVIDGNARARAFYAHCRGREGAHFAHDLLGHPIMVVPVAWDRQALTQLSEDAPQTP